MVAAGFSRLYNPFRILFPNDISLQLHAEGYMLRNITQNGSRPLSQRSSTRTSGRSPSTRDTSAGGTRTSRASDTSWARSSDRRDQVGPARLRSGRPRRLREDPSAGRGGSAGRSFLTRPVERTSGRSPVTSPPEEPRQSRQSVTKGGSRPSTRTKAGYQLTLVRRHRPGAALSQSCDRGLLAPGRQGQRGHGPLGASTRKDRWQ